jgi:thiol:disulfide interchange protein DsbD
MPRLLSALIILLLSTQASAQGGLDTLFGRNGNAILPVEQAFPVSVAPKDPARLTIQIDVQKGYYVYQNSLHFTIDGDRARTAEIKFPNAAIKNDEFFGRQPVFTQPTQITLTLDKPAKSNTPVEILLQGCAESGVCYPPYRVMTTATGGEQTWRINPQAPRISQNTAIEATPPPSAGGQAGRLERLLTQASLPAILAGFFLAGILLAFSACLYPMIPILSGLIAGDPHRRGSLRALGLSLVYVESTAITYTLAGVAAGMTGAAIQADLQSPWVLGSFAAVFVLLALGMFDAFALRMPSGLQTRFTALANRQRGGTLMGVAIMGILSSLIVGACSGPALIAALVFIGSTGDAWLGGLALFTLANGMGLPLLIIGTSAGRWLPRSGPWMGTVRAVFGVGFLAVALWMLERFLPGPITLALWGALLIGCGVGLGVFERSSDPTSGRQRLCKALGIALLIWGAASLLGAASGGRDVLQPLAEFNLSGETAPAKTLAFRDINSPAELNTALADARAAGRPVMIDVYADWCVYCVQLEQRTFTDAQVQQALASALLLRADVTKMTESQRALMQELNVYLPPAIVFYGPNGKENRAARVVSYLAPAAFIERARLGLQGGQP